MPISAQHSVSGAFFLSFLVIAGCGGSVVGIAVERDAGEPIDSGESVDSPHHDYDAGGRDVTRAEDAGCVNPTLGEACRPGVSMACPVQGDPCCIGYEWACDPASDTWTQAGLGCSCGGPVDSGFIESGADVFSFDASDGEAGFFFDASDGEAGFFFDASDGDAGFSFDASDGSDASDSCGGCGQGEFCVVTTSGGGCCTMVTTTYQCELLPAVCDGQLTQSCATELCGGCGSGEISESTVQCICLFP